MVRQRILFLYLRDHYVIEQRPRILHLSPERGLHRHLKYLPGYTAGDICPGARVTHVFDVQEVPFSTDTFDLILCSHVLEHVENDRAALAEFRRVLAPRGRVILQHPIKLSLAITFEDPTITSPAARRKAFGQHDHVRVYGTDFGDRLRDAGFEFEVVRYTDRLPSSAISWYGLKEEGGINGSDLYIAR
jgi:SAM-dependent methyltransferase